MSSVQNLLLSNSTPVQSAPVSVLDLKNYYQPFVKSVFTGGVFYGINTIFRINQSARSQLYSALAVGVSTGVGNMLIQSYVSFRTAYFPLLAQLQKFEKRIIESGSALAGTYVLDKVIMRNSYAMGASTLTVQNIIGIIASDLIGEALTDVFNNKVINLFD